MLDVAAQHEEREQHRGDALGTEPGDERLLRLGQLRPEEREQHRDRTRDEQREGDEHRERPNRALVAGRDDERPEDEERQDLEDRAHVLREVDEALRDLVLGDPERDRADERGDQAVAEGDIGEAEGHQTDADRVDALVAPGHAAGHDLVKAPADRPKATPSAAPNTASPTSCAASLPASPPGVARTRKKRTKGSARPSLSPDSRFSVWRIAAGTRCAVTTVEVTTGSVGESTAPSRNASAQVSSSKRSFAASARTTSVIGIANTSARATGLQLRPSSSRSTTSPSEIRVRISASSISSTIPASSTWIVTRSSCASTIPSRIESTDAESTVPRISPDSAATTASRAPMMSSASPNPRSINRSSPRSGRTQRGRR